MNIAIPGTCGQGKGHGVAVGIENGNDSVIPVLDPVGSHPGIFCINGENAGFHRLPPGLPQSLVGLAEGNQPPVIVSCLPVLRLVQGVPSQGIDPVRGTVAVFVKSAPALGLGAQHFLARLEEGHALGQHDKGRRQPALPDQRFPVRLRAGQSQPVNQGVVVMAGDIVDALFRPGCPAGHSHEAGVQSIFVADRAGNKAGGMAVKNAAPEQIPDGIAEEGNPGHFGRIALHRKLHTGPHRLGFHLPALAVEDYIWMAAVNGAYDLVHGLGVQQSHQVKPEAVNVVGIRPVIHGIHNVFAHHAPLGGGVIAAAGAIAVAAVFVDPAEIPGDDLVEGETPGVIDVVVDHVHHHAHSGVVDGLHHLLHFFDPHAAVKGVRGVGAFRHVEILRVIAPVVLGPGRGLVGVAIVIHRQQVDVGHPQRADVVQSGGIAAPGFSPGFRQPQKLSLIPDVAGAVHGQVPDVQLVEYRVGDAFPGEGVGVLVPALRLGVRFVQNHGPLAVYPHSPGVRVAGLGFPAVHIHKISVVQPLQIAHTLGIPGAIYIRVHLLPGQHLAAVSGAVE